MKRRHFILSMLSAGLAGQLRSTKDSRADMTTMGGMSETPAVGSTGQAKPVTIRTGQPLRTLPKLVNQSKTPGVFEARLTAVPARLDVGAGQQTEFWAYNGMIPGPLIEATAGDRVRILFENRIPGQESTIHWHGMPVPAAQDGNPMSPVTSGSRRVYEFVLPADSASSYWYHPHPHRLSAEQVYRGLAGAFIVKPKSDPLPRDIHDIVVFITDLRLSATGAIPANNMVDLMNGREGDHLLVNGQQNPVLTVAPGSTCRFRLYNATNARYLRLAFQDHEMVLIGTDGGYVQAPILGLKEILLSPAERADVIVTFAGRSGRTVALQTLPYERGWMGGGKPPSQTLSLLIVTLTGVPVGAAALPTKLRTIEELGTPGAIKRLEFGERMTMGDRMSMSGGGMDHTKMGHGNDGGMAMQFLINGKAFEMGRVDLATRAGQVELWEVVNPTDMDHPFHLHGTQFQVTEREKNGSNTKAPYLAWKDTVNVAKAETVRFKVRQNMKGQRMYHCHILEHEDQGMMGVLDVI
jgi:FtsP/CotA-like multicopper oxidase with cupredoxin domain